jgi:hypothetical protein
MSTCLPEGAVDTPLAIRRIEMFSLLLRLTCSGSQGSSQ